MPNENEIVEVIEDDDAAQDDAALGELTARVAALETVINSPEFNTLMEAIRDITANDVKPKSTHWLYKRVGGGE